MTYRALRYAVVLAVAAALLTGAASAGLTSAEPVLAAGNEHHLWLVQPDGSAGTFRVAVWPVGGQQSAWRHISDRINGRPVVAVATERRIHVLLADPIGHLTFTAQRGERRVHSGPPHELWPADAAPVAVCRATDFGPATGASILAVIASPLPAIEPAETDEPDEPEIDVPSEVNILEAEPINLTTPPAPVAMRLGVFQTVENVWQHVGDIDGPATDRDRVFCATIDQTLYVLVADPEAPATRLYTLSDGIWQETLLTETLGARRVVAMTDLAGQLTAVLSSRDDEADQIHARLAAIDPATGEMTLQLVARDGADILWPGETTLLATALGERLALVWSADDTTRYILCEPNGTAEPERTAGGLAHLSFDTNGQVVFQYVTIGLGVLLVAGLVIRRPRKQPLLMVLPRHLRPARFNRRILAALIDLTPAAAVIMLGFWSYYRQEFAELVASGAPAFSPDVWDMATRLSQTLPSAIIITGAFLVYLIYCTVTEALLGASPGKRLVGLRVISLSGGPLSIRQVLLRNTLKTLIFVALPPPLVLFVLVFWPMITPGKRQLGDILAGTLVVEPVPVMPLAPGQQPPGSPESTDDSDPPRDA